MSAALLLALVSQVADPLPRVELTRDDTLITSSCRLVLPAEPLADAAGDGVVQIRADGSAPLRVEFEGALHGAVDGVDPNAYTGIGVLVSGPDVTLVGPDLSGFRVGLEAREADRLVVLEADVSDNRRQRLRSTWEREDVGDWLTPHHNDDGEWKTLWGAGLVVERSRGVRIEGLRARDVQNGILLDRVEDSEVLRSDASFLSGWGLALWRSSGNRIEGNRFEHCVRGYAHGRYNRGQDSAGLLMFEQCSRNEVRSNSLTHSGDGVFGFAGLEALGKENHDPGRYASGLGSNANRFEGNDLSFAAAHGLELTFSFDNLVVANLLEGNAICGAWLGYARNTSVTRNAFLANGDAGYGSERGGVNAEHARGLELQHNRFEGNAVGVRLWSDPDLSTRSTPWAAANGMGAADCSVLHNQWIGDGARIELAQAERITVLLPEGDPGFTVDEASAASRLGDAVAWRAGEESARDALGAPSPQALRASAARRFHGLGPNDPLPAEPERGLRPAGRAAIVMTDWGPYDWTTPLVQPLERRGDLHRYRLLGPNSLTDVIPLSGAVDVTYEKALPGFPVGPDGLARAVVSVRPRTKGRAVPYRLIVRARGENLPVSGTLLPIRWNVSWFPTPFDPRQDVAAWDARVASIVESGGMLPEPWLGSLELDYGTDGPSAALARVMSPQQVRALEALGAFDVLNSIGNDAFGTYAVATPTLPAGTWRVRTRSDDGVRVRVDGRTVIEDWTWHAPRNHTAVFELDSEREVRLEVEHFELDGYATLSLELEPVGAQKR